MVGVAALQGNVGDRHLGVQQTISMFQAHFLDHLPRCQVEHALAVALQLRHGNTGDARQFAKRHASIEVRANVLIDRRQALIRRVRIARRLQVDRDPGQADDFIAAVIQRPLVSQAPTRFSTAVQVQLQLILQDKTLLQNASVLLGITGAQLLRKHLGAGFPQERFQLLQPAALHQRTVGHDIARLHILDEDRGIGNDIQHGQQQRNAGQQLLDGFGAIRVVALA
ncbi:hypothetical protein D3C84_768280 [compost metagenome]